MDTTKIEGYSEMTVEQKLAALESFEVQDMSSEVSKLKEAITKSNKEAADHKRKYTELLGAEEKKALEMDESVKSMQTELETLRKERQQGIYEKNFLAQGYSAERAASAATAMSENNHDEMFSIMKQQLEDFSKATRAEILKSTPQPPDGDAGKLDYASKIAEAQQSGDMVSVAHLTRLQYEATRKNE